LTFKMEHPNQGDKLEAYEEVLTMVEMLSEEDPKIGRYVRKFGRWFCCKGGRSADS